MDPNLVDPAGPDADPNTYEDNDYRLQPSSPCIDAGENVDWLWHTLDMDDNPRVWRGRSLWNADMGAYEYQADSFQVEHVVKKVTGGVQLTWASRPGDSYVVLSCTDLLNGSWSWLGTFPSEGASTSWTGFDTAFSATFYRVELR
jgi:hypothetical protein